MGLDMYLLRNEKNDVNNFNLKNEIGYWRKANHIHAWFVDNIQNGTDDCGYYEVPKEKAEELLNICNSILINRDIDNAEEMLPIRSGFFFGNTDYDESYFNNIEETKEILEEALKEINFDKHILVYTSSW